MLDSSFIVGSERDGRFDSFGAVIYVVVEGLVNGLSQSGVLGS
jgi:hypothetical protein